MKNNQTKLLPSLKTKSGFIRRNASACLTIVLTLLFLQAAFAKERELPADKPWIEKGYTLELKDKRTRTSKHFMTNDQKIATYLSPSSIHYLDKGNTWEEIDTRIVYNTGSNQSSHPYAAERNAVKTYFPSNPFQDYLVMETNEGRFKERVTAINFLNAAGQVIGTLPLNNTVTTMLDGNRIRYTGFHNDLSLEYTLGNDSRKFDLVVQSANFFSSVPANASSLSIVEEFIAADGSVIEFHKNDIRIVSQGETVFQVAQPVAFGTNTKEEEFTAGTLSLQQQQNTAYIQSSFPLAWLQHSARHFPIHLDPTVNYYPTNTTFWTGYQTSSTTKTSGQIRVTSGLNQGWAKFDLSALPVGCTVTQATYYGYHYSTTSTTKICQITGMGTVEPVAATAGAIAAQIPSGTQYNGNYTFGGATYSWNPGALNSNALTDIAAAAGSWIALGFSYLSGSTTFMYHYGINGFGLTPTPLPCYIEVVYFTVPCNSVPSANSVISPTYEICPGTSVVLTLANTYSVGGINYQWLSSTSSSVGPFVSVPNGTAATLITPTVNTPTWFSVVITCSAVTGNYTATAGEVLVEAVVVDNVPYHEGFENINALDDLPNCSWSASNLGVTAQTYTGATTNNRMPRTGSKFAAFADNPAGTTYFYTNGIQLNAGITYSASMWYTTEYAGHTNWTDLSILLGTSQSTTGLVPIASTNGPAVSNIYKLLSNTFSVPTSGVYYLAIRGTAVAGSADYLSWDDLEITIPCSLNSPTLSINTATNTICSGTQVNLLALGADSYSWSTGSTFDNITETPPSSITYSVIGTNSLSGCTTTAYQSIVVLNSPDVFAFANPLTVCAGSSVALQAFGAASYLWSQTSTGALISVSPLVTTQYTVTGIANNGCTGQAVVLVSVNPLPNVNVMGPTGTVCNGDMVSLTASGAGTFTWTNGNNMTLMTGNPLIISSAAATSYTVIGTDINGCQNSTAYVLNATECTGIAENSGALAFSLFPNPGTGYYTLRCEQGGDKTITITDLTGKRIYTTTFSGNLTEIHLEELAAGVYVAELSLENSVVRTKVIKN